MMCLGVFPVAALAAGSGEHSHGHEAFSVGKPGQGKPDRQIKVSMTDNGQTIEFIVRNDGKLAHEFSIGNAEDQARHAEMMRNMPAMKHEDPNTVSLEPGEQARLSWQFLGNDTVVFSCNIPGHFEAGMKHALAIGQN
jgi:uncharacterized cupredoxin-like copper-binding protein